MRQRAQSIGREWNQFWFTPRPGWPLVWVRQLVGIVALAWLLSLSPILTELFGESGWITPNLVHQVTTEGDLAQPSPGFSFLFLFRSPAWLWAAHLTSLVVLALVALGVCPRWSTPLALLVVLSYVHRAPMMLTSFESALCWLLLYLCFAPAGNVLGRRRPLASTWTATLAMRLIQVHVCAIYVVMSFSKLGSVGWVRGEAAWYLFTDRHYALLDLSALAASTYLVNAVTHLWLWMETLFPVVVWVRPLRAPTLTLAALIWMVRALVTGQVAFSALMIIASLAFLVRVAQTHADASTFIDVEIDELHFLRKRVN